MLEEEVSVVGDCHPDTQGIYEHGSMEPIGSSKKGN
jgi:hypothetical protein